MQLINKSARIFSINAKSGICKVAPNDVVEVEDTEGKRLIELCFGELVELKPVEAPKEEKEVLKAELPKKPKKK